MPTNKHASIRYEVLDKCLQKESENNTEINLRQICSDAIAMEDSNYESVEVSLRTFRSDIAHLKTIAEKHDVTILNRRGRYGYFYYYDKAGYSIFNNELSASEVGQLKCAMQLLSRFKGLPEYDSIAGLGAKLEEKYGIASGGQTYVEYEHVESTGEEMMADICNFIIQQRPIKITYMPYGKPEKDWIIHPYLLKEYNNRWFLFGYNETESKISNVALDRIRADYEPVANTFIPNTFVDFSEHFRNVVGVTVRDFEPTEIIFKASESRAPYIESKPLHHSQVIKDYGSRLFSITVIPNNELDALLLSYGSDIEIVSPSWYRDNIMQKIATSFENYFGRQNNSTPNDFLCNVNQSLI